MQFIDQEGNTIEEALAAALAVLGKSPREVEYEVLEENAQGDFPVMIRVYPSNELLLDVRDEVENLLDLLHLDGTAETRFEGENQIIASIDTVDSGIMIGQRGQTLDAFQHIVNAMLKLEHYHVVVDVAEYRQRHQTKLEEIAQRLARQVINSRRAIELKPMPASDRRIIHMTVQTFPELKTESIGEEPNRRIIISPTQQAARPYYRRPNFRGAPTGQGGHPNQGGSQGQGGHRPQGGGQGGHGYR